MTSDSPNRVRTLNQLAVHPAAHPVALDLWLIHLFGPDYLLWEPETLWREIELTAGRQPSEVVRNKIQAGRLVHVQESPYVAWDVFEKVIQAFDGTVPRFDIMQKPSVSQLLSGVDAMWTIRHQPLGGEVKRYCAAVHMDSGLLCAISPLSGIDSLLPAPPGVKEKVKSGLGDYDHVLQDDDLVDVQVGKLRVAKMYLDASRWQMLDQLRLLREETKGQKRAEA